ncbi:lipopolysaccharide assembly protein LapB, partial [Gracilinema caldarium]|uniref:tetratricopeptide repeat protein n=1 Tax=Gracilinema caldarium TaxID=215591 RepID=UPI0026ED6538
DLYLRLGQPASAVKTLERVLILNPSDIASLFTLARAKEQSGDWMGALSMYRRVYELNPRYENAAGSYNTLSALHGQLFQTGITSTLDSNRSANIFRMAYRIPLSSFAELFTQYSLDHIKIHTPVASTQSLTLHSLNLQLPISVSSWGLTLYGELGGSLHNKLENIIPPQVADFNLDVVSDYAAVAPQLGGGISWQAGPFKIGTYYGFHQIKDTFFADRFAQYEHQAGASIQIFLDYPNRQFVRSFSFQTDGTYRSIFSPYFSDQTNIIYGGKGELHLQNVLAQKPQILLDVGALGSWDDSEKSSTDYYTPAQAFTIKGGAELAVQLINGTNWIVTGAGRFWSGWFASAGSTGSVLFDGAVRLEGVRKNLSLYLAVGGNRTGETYWAYSLEIGGSIRLADYIIP